MLEIKVKTLEIELTLPMYEDERSLVKQISTFKSRLQDAAGALGVTVDDIYLDESTGNIVVRLETIEGDRFVGSFRINTWIERVAKKFLRYE